MSANFEVSPGGDAFETTTATTDPAFHRSVYVSTEDQSTGGIAGFASNDAGGSWSQGPLPSPTTGPKSFLALPSAAFDSANNLYESYLAGAVNGASVTTQLLVARSADRGHSWAAPRSVESANIPDTPQVAVDTTGGMFNNRIYLAYDTNPGNPSPGNYSQPLYLAHSEDGVAWTKTKIYDSGGDREGHPALGPNGEVYVAWDDYCGGTMGGGCLGSGATIRIARSDDGGSTFPLNGTSVAALGAQFPYLMASYSNNCGGSGPTPIEPSPSVAVDRSGGPHQGTVYAVFTGKISTAGLHVYFARSTDKGANWSVSRLDTGNPDNGTNGRDSWGPALAVDQSNGAVTVAWYDRRDDLSGLYRVYYTQSIDGGQTFLPNQIAVSDRYADPTVDCLATGAYMQMRASDGIAQPFWTDTNSGSIMSAFISERANVPQAMRIFESPTSYTVAQATNGAGGIVTGDFDGDGKVDLAVLGFKSGAATISVFLGKGDGTFTAGPVSPIDAASSNAGAIVSTDFDGDGKLDLAISGTRCPPSPALCQDVVWFLSGIGNGTFVSATYKVIPPIGYLKGIALGVLTTSGKPDVVVDNGDQGIEPHFLQILVNTSTSGVISFNDAVSLNVRGTSPVVADFNHDGKNDIAYINSDQMSATPIVGLLLGKGDGTFQAGQTYPAPNRPYALLTGDLNRDGKADLVAGGGGNLMILLGNGDGTFKTSSPLLSGAYFGAPLAISDVTGDGVPDILADCSTAIQQPRAICVLLGAGDGSFGSPSVYPYSNTAYAANGAAIGDFNGDGKADLAVTQNGQQSFFVFLHTNGRLSGIPQVGFGTVPMGQAAYRDVVLSNSGSTDVHISFVGTETPDFTVVNDPCSDLTLPPVGSCTVSIRFTPNRLQSERASLIAVGDAIGATLTISLDGMGARGSAPATGPTYQFRPRTSSGSNTQPVWAAKAASAPALRFPASGGGKSPVLGFPSFQPNDVEPVMARFAAALVAFMSGG